MLLNLFKFNLPFEASLFPLKTWSQYFFWGRFHKKQNGVTFTQRYQKAKPLVFITDAFGVVNKFSFSYRANLSKLINFYFPWYHKKPGFLIYIGRIEAQSLGSNFNSFSIDRNFLSKRYRAYLEITNKSFTSFVVPGFILHLGYLKRLRGVSLYCINGV